MEIGSLLLNQRFAVPIVPYTEADLRDDLAQGVGNVLAGIGSDYRLNVSADAGTVLIQHKDVNTAGLGAAYSGALRCALGLTANGLIAGYNRKSDGAWVNSLVIDATTGSATFEGTINATNGNFSGTINAGAVIAGGALVNGTTMLTIKNQAAAGATAVQPAAIAGMLTRTSSYILGGTMSIATTDAGAGIRTGNIAWDANGTVNAGSGVAITAKGIVGANNGVVTFSIDGSTGAATFKGDVTGASGTFSGAVSTSSYVTVDGVGVSGAFGVSASIKARASGFGAAAVYGEVLNSGAGAGVYGKAAGVINSGVRGENPSGVGGFFQGLIAVDCYGKLQIRSGTSTTVAIREVSGMIRMTDSYATDAYMIMATSYGAGSGATATLGAKLGVNTAMSGWITAKVAGATVYIPFWQ